MSQDCACRNLNPFREFFEHWADDEALAPLQQIEEECC